jgi:hypothetical protein
MSYNAPRSLLVRETIMVLLTASELHGLIQQKEAEAVQAEAEGKVDFADFLFRRVAELREATR